MLPRVYVPDVDPEGGDTVLPAGEAHHLGRVLRLGAGAEIRVFDGRGGEYRAQVTSAAREAMRIRLLERVDSAPMPRVSLTVVQSILKGEAMDGVVRDCTMLGAAAIQPVISERTTVKSALVARARGRWERVALAAAKQCGRSTLPVIGDPLRFDTWLNRIADGMTFLLVEPAVAAGALKLRDLTRRAVPEAASLIVGPEGGWTAAEHDAALAAGCTPLVLGPLTLRAEATPLAACAALLALWEG
jgi:16S rRNA (uracil1498-N3)-methyltransferase